MRGIETYSGRRRVEGAGGGRIKEGEGGDGSIRGIEA